MTIKKLVLGDLYTNCYILEKEGYQLLIDPAAEYEIIKEHLTNLVGILITHYHFDHIGALNELKDDYNVSIYDYKTLGNQVQDNFKFEVISTKGHHDTCVCFKFDDIIFDGDFIFENGIGRTDLETGNDLLMEQSLLNFKKYNNTHMYPGHGNDFILDIKDYII